MPLRNLARVKTIMRNRTVFKEILIDLCYLELIVIVTFRMRLAIGESYPISNINFSFQRNL